MKQNYDFKIDKIKDLSSEEISLRKKNLDLFYQTGFPNKKDEDWKFSDLNSILSNNFNKISNNDFLPRETEFKIIDEFEHKKSPKDKFVEDTQKNSSVFKPQINPEIWLSQRGLAVSKIIPILLEAKLWKILGIIEGPNNSTEEGSWEVIENPWSNEIKLFKGSEDLIDAPSLRGSYLLHY